jgi:mevalonate kinase
MLDMHTTIERIMNSKQDIPGDVKEVLEEIQDFIMKIIETLGNIKKEIEPNFDTYNDYIRTGEYYRYLFTFINCASIISCKKNENYNPGS